jgi:hypothetical protein
VPDNAIGDQSNGRQDNQVADSQDKTPPLIRQAAVLEGIIKPRVVSPVVRTDPSSNAGPQTTSRRPPEGTAKFGLVGVSYFPSDPKNSFAYVRMPDNSYLWVQQGSEVGHFVVKEVKSGSIVYSDGQRMSEMMVEATIDTASVLETGGGLPVPSASGLAGAAAMSAPGHPGIEAPVPNRAVAAVSSLSAVRLSAQDEEGLSELVRRLKPELTNAKNARSDQVDSNTAPGEPNAAVGRLISEIKSARVSAEEAEKLENLGEQLNGAKDDQKAGQGQMDEKRRELMRRLSQPRSPKQ